jgi:hypothetical protein
MASQVHVLKKVIISKGPFYLIASTDYWNLHQNLNDILHTDKIDKIGKECQKSHKT